VNGLIPEESKCVSIGNGIPSLRAEVRELCARYSDEYWGRLDCESACPQ
jgi:hypothetical protein